MLYLCFIFIFFIFIVCFFFYRSFVVNINKNLLKEKNIIVIMKKKIDNNYGCLYWDVLNNKLYCDCILFSYFNYLYNYYFRFFKFPKMSFLLSSLDVDLFTYDNKIYFSSFFSFIINFMREKFFKLSYWILFFFSMLIFILIAYIVHKYYGLVLLDSTYYNVKIFKYILFFVFYFLINLYFFFNKIKIHGNYIYDSIFVKVLVFSLNLLNNFPMIVNNFLCFILNFYLLYLLFDIFWSFNLFLFTLALYSSFILIWRILHEFSNYLIQKGSVKKIIIFFSTYKLQSILLFPIATIILFIFYKIYWWIYFFIRCYLNFGFKFFVVIVYDYNKLSKYDFGKKVTEDDLIFDFLVSAYWFDDYAINVRTYLGDFYYNKLLTEFKNKGEVLDISKEYD